MARAAVAQVTLASARSAALAKSAVAPSRAPADHPVAQLNRAAGNQAVVRLLRSGHVLRRHCAGCASGAPCASCAEEEQETLRRQVAPAALSAGAATRVAGVPRAVYDVLRTSGNPLDPATRISMERSFGCDFGDVRVHTDVRAAESARAVNALAYTVGRHIVFDSGQYAPATVTGRRLMAHELAHTTQQRSAPAEGQAGLVVGASDDAAEVEARRAADQTVAGFASPAMAAAPAAAVVRRQEREDETPETSAAEKPISRAEELQISRTSRGEVTGTARPPLISLYNFAIDSALPKERHGAALAEVADLIKQGSAGTLGVVVIGHADSSGSPAINKPLSKRRAEAVQRALARLSGRSIDVAWSGATSPAASNDTVEGRARNRRVDIVFLPVGGVTLAPPSAPTSPGQPAPAEPTPEQPAPPASQPPATQPPTTPGGKEVDEKWFCSRHPILCTGIAGGVAAGAALLFCILNPEICLAPFLPPGGPGGPDGPPKEPKEPEKDKEPRPCVVSVSLPSGTRNAKYFTPATILHGLWDEFSMKVTFKDDDTGCSCALSEYKQMVKCVFAERDRGTGVMKTEAPPGITCGPGAAEQEDLFRLGALLRYGVRSSPIGNRDGDEFLPDRNTGCEYQGSDRPGMPGGVPGEHMRFKFEFRGGPVDRATRMIPVGQWSSWTVIGDHIVAKPTPPPPPAVR